MYSCPLHNWNSFEIPCPSCQTTVTTGGDVPIQIMAQQSPSKDTGVLAEALQKTLVKLNEGCDWRTDNAKRFKAIEDGIAIVNLALSQYSSPSLPEPEGKGQEEMEVLRDMYNDQCCLTQILLKAVNEIVLVGGGKVYEVAKKAQEDYDDIVHMK